MKAIGLQIAMGIAIILGSATANAEAPRSRTDTRIETTAEHFSSRHRCACRSARHHRLVRMHKGHHKARFYSNYPHAPWYSRHYLPRWRDDYPKPIVIVYRQ
jgi:hypothetical protein